jgi:hypothetical protein
VALAIRPNCGAAKGFRDHEAGQHKEPGRLPIAPFENARRRRSEVRYSQGTLARSVTTTAAVDDEPDTSAIIELQTPSIQ